MHQLLVGSVSQHHLQFLGPLDCGRLHLQYHQHQQPSAMLTAHRSHRTSAERASSNGQPCAVRRLGRSNMLATRSVQRQQHARPKAGRGWGHLARVGPAEVALVGVEHVLLFEHVVEHRQLVHAVSPDCTRAVSDCSVASEAWLLLVYTALYTALVEAYPAKALLAP